MLFLRELIGFFGLMVVFHAQGVPDKPFYQSEAFRDMRLAGYEVVLEKDFDLNGDGRLDALVLEKSKKGMGVSAWTAAENGEYVRVFRTEADIADEVAAFTMISLGIAHRVWLVDVFEDNPDEEDHRVKLILIENHRLREIFSAEYRKIHSERDAGRASIGVLDFGGKASGLSIEPDPDGWPVLKIYDKEKKISVRDANGRTFWLVIGIQEQVFAFSKGRYQQTQTRYLDYLPAIIPASVSSQPIGGNPGLDGQNMAEILIDNQTKTGIGLDPGKDGSVFAFRFQRREKIRMIRLLPVCLGRDEAVRPCNQQVDFDIQFDAGRSIQVRRQKGLQWDEQILAVGDFSIPGSQAGTQTFVFFKQPIQAQSARLLVRASRHFKPGGDETLFISELSMHQSLTGSAIGQNDSHGS